MNLTLGTLLTIGFTVSFTLILGARIYGYIGEGDPSMLMFVSVPLVISIIVFLIQAANDSDKWFKGFWSILKLLFATPLLWSLLLSYMMLKIGFTMGNMQKKIGREVIFNMGDQLNYTMALNLISTIIFILLLYTFSVTEPLVTAINVSGFCSFLLIITAVMNMYFYVELTTKPVLP